MIVLQINTVYPQGSTGKICKEISIKCRSSGIENYIAYSHDYYPSPVDKYTIKISSWFDHHVHNRLARVTMGIGEFSYFRTIKFLNAIKRIDPDVIHLHNLHGNYINLKLLFNYIKRRNIPIIWTLHDCWAFTGYCAYYTVAKCEKWKNECHRCPNRNQDSVTLFDRSQVMFRKKKKLFCGINKMKIVVPSNWLKHEIESSFLKDYEVRVINNGINLEVFKPTRSDFKRKNNIKENDFVILGVANVWDSRKGIYDFIELSKRLDDNYRIVLVGTNDEIDELLPKTIISIHRTQNQTELAEIYSSADLFVNPTREDNFPTVNIEAIACGTPVLTYATGGSWEMLDSSCGSAVVSGDIDSLVKEIRRICNDASYTSDKCVKKAREFDMNARFQEYVDLYEEVVNDRITEGGV